VSLSKGRIQIVADVDQLVRRSACEVPEVVVGRLVFNLPEGSEAQKRLEIPFGDPSEVYMGVNMDHYTILEPSLLPCAIGSVVFLHHHDSSDRIDPDKACKGRLASIRIRLERGRGC